MRVQARKLLIACFGSVLERQHQTLLKRGERTLREEPEQPLEIRQVAAQLLFAAPVDQEHVGGLERVDADARQQVHAGKRAVAPPAVFGAEVQDAI